MLEMASLKLNFFNNNKNSNINNNKLLSCSKTCVEWTNLHLWYVVSGWSCLCPTSAHQQPLGNDRCSSDVSMPNDTSSSASSSSSWLQSSASAGTLGRWDDSNHQLAPVRSRPMGRLQSSASTGTLGQWDDSNHQLAPVRSANGTTPIIS